MTRNTYILDFESVVADLSECYSEAFSVAFKQFKMPFDRSRLEEYMTTPLDVMFGRYYKGCTCKFRDFVIMFMGAFDSEFSRSVLRPGIKEKIAGLKSEGCRIGVISECYEMYANRFLSENGLDTMVDAVFGMDRTPIARPDPYVLKECLKELGSDISNSVFVSGTERDMKMCQSLGMEITGTL